MTSARVDSPERVDGAWKPVGGAMPATIGTTSSTTPSQQGADSRATGSLLRTALRFARNAAIGLAMIVAVPIVVVAWKGPSISLANTSSLATRLADLEQMRPYSIRAFEINKGESITPMMAGQALHRLQAHRKHDAFPMQDAGERHERPWKTQTMMPDMFRKIGRDFTVRDPQRIIAAVNQGFSVDEMMWLKTVAEAPIWNDFDLVARAPAVDVIGGQYALPFRGDASIVNMPIPGFQGTKELASAAMARAAYHMANREYEKAEAVLQSVVSFGFAYIDNASSSFDPLLGRVLMEMGRDGLTEFYRVTGAPIRNAEALERPTYGSVAPSRSAGDPRDWRARRAQLIAEAADPQRSRGLRLESLRALSFGVCSSPAEMLMGHSDEVSNAYRAARTSLARYPSEEAFLQLMLQASDRRIAPDIKGPLSHRLIGGASEVAATILGNPRVAGCTRLALALGN